MNQKLTVTGGICLLMGFVAFIAGAMAIGLAIQVRQDQRLASLAKSIPQTIHLEDLAAKGPGDNIHINLTQFEPGRNYLVTNQKNSFRWATVHIPLYPKGQAETGKPCKVVLKSTTVQSADEVENLAQRAMIEGVVVNSLSSEPSAINKLNEKGSNLDVKSVWIVEEGWKIMTPQKIDELIQTISFLAGGAVMAMILTIYLAISENRKAAAAARW